MIPDETRGPESGHYSEIFLLGSGFSKSFCPSMPTLKDLNGRIPDAISPECQALRDYCYELRELCRNQPEFMNIEAVATSILAAQVFAGEQERLHYASLRFELLKFIAKAMRRDTPLSAEASRTLSAFLEYAKNNRIQENRKTLLLSFNYDTLIEDQIRQDKKLAEEISMDYGVAIEPADRSACRTPLGYSIDLLKLHGSLNWYTVKGAGAELDLKNVCHVEPGDRSYPLYRNENPLFIPMAHAKESFLRGSLFNVIWAKADYYLSHADNIYIIGYGFPKTDINNIAFLLKHRDRIRRVVIFENDDLPALERIRRLFDPGIVISKDAKEYVKGSL